MDVELAMKLLQFWMKESVMEADPVNIEAEGFIL